MPDHDKILSIFNRALYHYLLQVFSSWEQEFPNEQGAEVSFVSRIPMVKTDHHGSLEGGFAPVVRSFAVQYVDHELTSRKQSYSRYL